MAGQQDAGVSSKRRASADAAVEAVRQSMAAPVSPPRKRKRDDTGSNNTTPTIIRSPFQLTAIRDLPSAANVDAVTVQDLFGDPLIAEVWEFNFLHDIDFFMDALDSDVRHLVRVHVVHGFWKREDPQRAELAAVAARYENVRVHTAFMPEPFGTHHSKMAVLFRHDDTAQVVIYTANMIPHDWANMTQGVWRSPLLPLEKDDANTATGPVGSGSRFKKDLLQYLGAYNTRRSVCQPLVDRLARHDFSAVRAALIASVPGRYDLLDTAQWGWAALKNTLRSVPVQETSSATEIVAQISSMATLGPTDAWLQRTFFQALATSRKADKPSQPQPLPKLRVVFPTADEIRRSLNGYESGTSIHTKIQSAQQQKQLLYMRPMLCHWANDAPQGRELAKDAGRREAGRKRAAPHIKTYVRYGTDGLDWALLTSANLSKQAWGEAVSTGGQMRIASWEIGVMVWPGLFGETAVMRVASGSDDSVGLLADGEDRPVVALRIPYDLPLQRYSEDETPWVATLPDAEPDCKGRIWDV